MLTVNLFDSNYDHTDPICSTAHQVSEYIQYTRRQTGFDGITMFTDEWVNNDIVDSVHSRYKIGWLHEPYCLHPETYERALNNLDKFDLMMTYHQPFLNISAKFVYCPYAGTWIDKKQWGIKPKSKLCSMLIGSKMSTWGHRMRHDAANMIEENKFSVDFFGARGFPIGYGQETKVTILKDYYFSLATETCHEPGLFSEWLGDCFILGTIPIFWGAPDMGRFFDTNGILSFETVEELKTILDSISIDEYPKRMQAVEYNYRSYIDNHFTVTEDWIYQNVFRNLA